MSKSYANSKEFVKSNSPTNTETKNKNTQVYKGRKKSCKSIFRPIKDYGSLLIDGKDWKCYFNEQILSDELQQIISQIENSKNIKLEGMVRCYGGGVRSRLYSIRDAFLRSTGESVRNDLRVRHSNSPGCDVKKAKQTGKR